MNQMGLKNVFITFHQKTKQCTFLSAPHGFFSEIDHMIRHKICLKRYKKFEIIPCILPDHLGLKLDFNNNKNNRKPTYLWKLNNSPLSDNLVRGEINKLKVFWNLMKMKAWHT
jgi:hypothetical protein